MEAGCLIGLWSVLGACVLCVLATVYGSDPIIKTEKGTVRGFRIEVLEKGLDVFYGIPYAKPPVGDLRFRHPQPNEPWKGIYNATKKPNSCVQTFDTLLTNFSGAEMWNANTAISEDCLYLNVWVPQENKPIRNKAVLVWIYGGGFYSGTSTLDVYDPRYLATVNDVIVVSMQYRVGTLGFLSLSHMDAPGNAGMFDQLLALDWVQKNIVYFGGSTQNVTLFGESAGAVSVAMHLISPLSRAKFNRVIMESGSVTCDWAVMSPEEARLRAKDLAKEFKCSNLKDAGAIIECLKTKPAKEFPIKEWHIVNGISQYPLVLVVDGTFLVETPQIALERGNFKKIPILIGSNKNEGTYFLIYDKKKFFSLDNESLISRKHFPLLLDALFKYYPSYRKRLNRFGREAVLYAYTHWKDPDDQVMNRNMLDQAVGDYHFLCQVNELALAYAKANLKVYYYYFTHRSSQSPWPQWMGVIHAAEINFVFGEPLDPSKKYTKEEKQLSRKIMAYWTNFAKTGDPNRAPGKLSLDEWPLHTITGREYLTLDVKYLHEADKSKAIGVGPRIKECAFWKEYLPLLVSSTADISDAEREWKLQFREWSTKYIVDWKHQFDNFLKNHEKRMQACGGVKNNG